MIDFFIFENQKFSDDGTIPIDAVSITDNKKKKEEIEEEDDDEDEDYGIL